MLINLAPTLVSVLYTCCTVTVFPCYVFLFIIYFCLLLGLVYINVLSFILLHFYLDMIFIGKWKILKINFDIFKHSLIM